MLWPSKTYSDEGLCVWRLVSSTILFLHESPETQKLSVFLFFGLDRLAASWKKISLKRRRMFSRFVLISGNTRRYSRAGLKYSSPEISRSQRSALFSDKRGGEISFPISYAFSWVSDFWMWMSFCHFEILVFLCNPHQIWFFRTCNAVRCASRR